MGLCAGKASYEPKGGPGEVPGELALPLHEGHILAIKRLGDSSRICSCGSDASIVISNWESQSIITKLLGHKKAVSRVVDSTKNSNLLCSASRDLSIKMWNIESGQCIQTILDAHSLNITGLAMSPDGNMICSGSRDYSTKIWDVETGELLREYSCSRNIVTCVAWPFYEDHLNSPLTEGNIVLQGSEDLCIRGWDSRQSGKQPALHITGFQYFPLCMAVDDSRPLLAAGCKGFNGVGCDVKLWDVRYIRPGKFLTELSGHQQDVTCCQFLPNSPIPLMLSGSRDSTIKCWPITVDHRQSEGWRPMCTSFSDRSSYNCLDVWRGSDLDSWMGCLGDMDGSISVLSIEKSLKEEVGFTLKWKSAPYVSAENYDGGDAQE